MVNIEENDTLFAVVNTMNAGSETETKKFQEKGFKLGQKNKVIKVDMAGFHTDIKLEGHNESFNSCFFTFEKNGVTYDIYSDPKYYTKNLYLKRG